MNFNKLLIQLSIVIIVDISSANGSCHKLCKEIKFRNIVCKGRELKVLPELPTKTRWLTIQNTSISILNIQSMIFLGYLSISNSPIEKVSISAAFEYLKEVHIKPNMHTTLKRFVIKAPNQFVTY